jgi:tetratricopeptide (TPR) repeat protein
MIRCVTPLLLCVLCTSAGAQDYVDEIKAGRRLYETGRFEEALPHFARARTLVPDDWRGHAWQTFTLIEQARGTEDRARRLALLREAEEVTSVLVKRKIVLFQDPLYKFALGVVHQLRGDEAKAFDYFHQAYRSPRDKFAAYREIQLRQNVERAFAMASVQLATWLIMRGGGRQFERADRLLEEAARLLPEDDPERILLERQFAVVSENLQRHEKAIRHLRRCIELTKDDPPSVQELTAAIALIHFTKEEFENGINVLKELPPDCDHPEVIAARATAHYKQAMAAPDGEEMATALTHHRDALKKLAVRDRNRLVVPFVELVLEKVGPRDVEKQRALLREAEQLAKREIDLRPECPSLYFHLYRIYRLLGKENLAIHYQDLHKQKKDEYSDKDHYDARGRPRCR